MDGRDGRDGRDEERELGGRLGELCRLVVDAGFAVHRALGPGLLESVYERCLARALTLRGLSVERQVPLAIEYEGLREENAFRLDLLVESQIVVEVKASAELTPLHRAQLRTYLKLSEYPVGPLMNFNVVLFKHGLRRLQR